MLDNLLSRFVTDSINKKNRHTICTLKCELLNSIKCRYDYPRSTDDFVQYTSTYFQGLLCSIERYTVRNDAFLNP
jgi:hypothetical protein